MIKAKIKAKDEAYRTKHIDPELYRFPKSYLRKAIMNAKRPRKIALSKPFTLQIPEKFDPTSRRLPSIKSTKRSVDTNDTSLPDKLNHFHTRFEKENDCQQAPFYQGNVISPFSIDVNSVKYKYERPNDSKAAGPGITPKLLRKCVQQLVKVYTDFLFGRLT
ncbi:hypothetical protein HOLleu_18152 [Holothuria leucospilota]|uniref:Uncharacterized protein n=1 Tax=Holothuria leucospilota TaxID=206669 RepID=A0A9Q1C3D0_HOLLE|nr:hypothetical protein HOLleu_18152 [Holothuria leucospilota]